MYFNHAYQKCFLGSGDTGGGNNNGWIADAVAGGGVATVDFYNTYGAGAFDFVYATGASAWTTVGSTAPSGGEPLILVTASLYQNDKVGPYHGGYQETTKSKIINPKYVNKFYKVQGVAPINEILTIGQTSNNSCACPEFYCNETYGLRIDLKGSPALRFLNHNAYEVACAYTGCCDGPTPELVDPASVMMTWAQYLLDDPIFSGFEGQSDQRFVRLRFEATIDGGSTWTMYFAPGTTALEMQAILAEAIGGNVLTTSTLVAGSGYTNGSYTNIPFTGGTGTGYTANVVVAGGVVTSITTVNPGSGYTAADVLTVGAGVPYTPGTVSTIVAATVGTGTGNSTATLVDTWDNYVGTGFAAAPADYCAGLIIEAAYVETKFGDCTFQTTDFFEKEPIQIFASLLDETGDPCVFESICVNKIQEGVQGMGFGEQVLRDLVLSESYAQNSFNNSGDLRVREITQGYDISNAVNRNALYTCYFILHSVPRPSNPTSVHDNDQYLLAIPVLQTQEAGLTAFETFINTWLTNAGSTVQMETF